MRLFIAIPVPPDIQRATADVATRLQAQGASGRFVPQGNYHVTLHFIGESDDLVGAADAMHAAVRGVRPFLLRMGEYGNFPGKAGSTGFVRMQGELEELNALYEMLEAQLWERGFSRGSGRFIPHITLGRSITGDDGFTCGRHEAFTVNQVILYETRMSGGKKGAADITYVPVHREMLL